MRSKESKKKQRIFRKEEKHLMNLPSRVETLQISRMRVFVMDSDLELEVWKVPNLTVSVNY